MLAPHSFSTKIELARPPHIFLTERAWKDQEMIVRLSTKEVGWLGIVYDLDGDFLIDEIFMPTQIVSSSFCELNEEGLAKVGTEILGREKGLEESNQLKYWGHSHCNMATTPSGQDETQMDLFKNNDCDFAIRGILNKLGNARFDIFYFSKGIVVRDAKWSLYSPDSQERSKYWTAQIRANVTIRPEPVKPKPCGKVIGQTSSVVPQSDIDALKEQGYYVGDDNEFLWAG